jgi:hypothetical protein
VHTCNSSYSGGRGRQEDPEFKTSLLKVSKTLSQKQNKNKSTRVKLKSEKAIHFMTQTM